MPTKLRQASGSGFDAILAFKERGSGEGCWFVSSSKPTIPPAAWQFQLME